MLRKMGKSGLEVQEIKKDIKNQKFEIQKKKKKVKTRQGIIYKTIFSITHNFFYGFLNPQY